MHPVLRKPIIAIESSLDFQDLAKAKVQHTDDRGVNRKIEVPVADGSSFKGVLYTIREFNAASNTLMMTNGPDLFNNFRLCLVGNAKEEWDIVIQDQDQTLDGFTEMIRRFKLVFTTHETKEIMLEYLQSVSKPKDMEVHAFVRRMQSINRYIADMPDDNLPPSLNEMQLKNSVFHAMPLSWQQAFSQSSRRLSDSSLEEIIEYMETQKSYADRIHMKRKHKRSRSDADDNDFQARDRDKMQKG